MGMRRAPTKASLLYGLALLLAGAMGGLDQSDRLPDRIVGRKPVELLGAMVPAGDHTLQRLADDRLLGGLDDGRQIGPLLAEISEGGMATGSLSPRRPST